MGNIERIESSPELDNEKLYNKYNELFGKALEWKTQGPEYYEDTDKKHYHELNTRTKEGNGIANGGKTILKIREIIIEDKKIDKKTKKQNTNMYSLKMTYQKTPKGVSIKWKYNDGKIDKYITSTEELNKVFIDINNALVKMEENNYKGKTRKYLNDLAYEISSTDNQENEPNYA